jgi:hypothetical protein
MRRLQRHERLRMRAGRQESQPSDTFLEDIAEAYALGTCSKADVKELGRGTKWDDMEPANVRMLEGLGRGNSGVRNAAWAAFYLGVLSRQPEQLPTWHCIIQQQLTKAFFRLPTDAAKLLLESCDRFGQARREWMNVCSGALAVARVGHAFQGVPGRLYLPRLREDVYGKIDLIFQCESLVRGLCLQIKSDATQEITTGYLIDEDSASEDPDGYLRRVLKGVDRFGGSNPGRWLPILLVVGQRPYLDSAEVRACPHVAAGVAELLARHLPPVPVSDQPAP